MISDLIKPGCASKQDVLEIGTLQYVSCKSIPSQQNSYRITLRILIGKIDGFASKCDSKIDSQWLREIIWFFFELFLLSNVIQTVTELWMRMTTAIKNAETGGRHWNRTRCYLILVVSFLSCFVLFLFIIKWSRL